jgi:hypothetical protein
MVWTLIHSCASLEDWKSTKCFRSQAQKLSVVFLVMEGLFVSEAIGVGKQQLDSNMENLNHQSSALGIYVGDDNRYFLQRNTQRLQDWIKNVTTSGGSVTVTMYSFNQVRPFSFTSLTVSLPLYLLLLPR